MNNLTAKERRIFNNLSRVHSPSVFLGNKIQEIISAIPSTFGSPVNAKRATGVLTVGGVVVHGETVTIDNPASILPDIYEFLGDTAQSKSNPIHIAVDITAHATKASGSLTIDTQPTAGDTITIGVKEYIFVADGTEAADGDISIGTDVATARLAIVAAINGTDNINEPHDLVIAGAFVGDTCPITAIVAGTAGNAIATTSALTAVTNIFGAAALALGTDCPAADAIALLVAAITASDSQGVTAAVDGATIVLTAVVPGVLAHTIGTEETMANGSFAADHLSGGVDGTVAPVGTVMVDATYLYVTVADNSIVDANWRRIAVGAAY